METNALKKCCMAWQEHGGSFFTMLEDVWDIETKKHYEYGHNTIISSAPAHLNSNEFIGFSVFTEFGSLVGHNREGLKEYIEAIEVTAISVEKIETFIANIGLNLSIQEYMDLEQPYKCFQLFEPGITTDAWFYMRNKSIQLCFFIEYER